MSRPELIAPPDIFYNDDEAKKYSSNSRIIKIQVEMCERAIELLALPDDQTCLILDIGCGSGLSGQAIEEAGHMWIGTDISPAMLDVAVDREVEGGLVMSDMGHGMPFKAGTFDAAISISALQWLCYANKTSQNPRKRLYKFFSTLLASLTRQARCVFQFYPNNSEEIEMITTQAMKAGFYGGLVVDFPNSTKAKKYFLVLMTGGAVQLPKALGTGDEENTNRIAYTKRREMAKQARQSRGKPTKGSKDWIMKKKERRRQQGKDVRNDSKYTARKRPGHF